MRLSGACAAVGERERKAEDNGKQEEAHGDGHCCQGESGGLSLIMISYSFIGLYAVGLGLAQ